MVGCVVLEGGFAPHPRPLSPGGGEGGRTVVFSKKLTVNGEGGAGLVVRRDWHGSGVIGTLICCGSGISGRFDAPAAEVDLWQSPCFVASVPRQ